MVFLQNINQIDPGNLFIIPILSDSKQHYLTNRISFIYLFNLETYQEYILNYHHNDSCQYLGTLELKDLDRIVYCYKKKFLGPQQQDMKGIQAKDSIKIYEAELVFWFQTNQRLKVEFNSTINQFHSWYQDRQNINDIIPIMKWIEYCREVKDRWIIQFNQFKIDDAFLEYDRMIDGLTEIERNGIGQNEYSDYSIFSLTGRPSNHFNGINYSALNKSDGSRKRFISRFSDGFLIEIDLSGFHLYLLHLILNIPFPENIYEVLGKIYFKKNELSNEELTESKTITFRQIYGGIDREYQSIEPFKSIHNLERQVFIDYKLNNLKTFLFDRKVNLENLPGLNQSKIFNYLLQNLETEFNSNLIRKLNDFLKVKHSKLILYNYDSFLIDYSSSDQCLKSILDIFEDIPFKVKAGKNYHQMKIMKI